MRSSMSCPFFVQKYSLLLVKYSNTNVRLAEIRVAIRNTECCSKSSSSRAEEEYEFLLHSLPVI